MKSAVLFLSIASLALAAPAIADARPDGKGQRAERRERVRGDEGRPGRVRGDGPRERPDARSAPRQRPDGRPEFRQRRNSIDAHWAEQQYEVEGPVAAGRMRSLREVLPGVQRLIPGRLLDAGLEQGWQGQRVYRVRWAAENGRRIDLIVDARTGRILEVEGQ